MQEITRYLLAFAVLASGYYGASRFRVSRWPEGKPGGTGAAEEVASAPAAIAGSGSTSEARQPVPLAALIDTERELAAKSEAAVSTIPVIPPSGQKVAAAPAASPRQRKPPSDQESSGLQAPTPERAQADGTKPAGTQPEPAQPEAAKPEANQPQPAPQVAEAEATKPEVSKPVAPSSGPFLPELAAGPGDRFSLFEELPEGSDLPAAQAAGTADPHLSKSVAEDPRTSRPEAVGVLHRHRITDGDTLPKLAARYLGDRSRYEEIYRQNPGILTDPRLLPIGAEVEIPCRGSSAADLGQESVSTAEEAAGQSAGPADRGSLPPAEEPTAGGHGSKLEPIPPQALPPREPAEL